MSDLPPRPSYADLERDLLRRGWTPDRQRGSHLTFASPDGRRAFPLPVQHRSRTASRRVVSTYRRSVLRAEA